MNSPYLQVQLFSLFLFNESIFAIVPFNFSFFIAEWVHGKRLRWFVWFGLSQTISRSLLGTEPTMLEWFRYVPLSHCNEIECLMVVSLFETLEVANASWTGGGRRQSLIRKWILPSTSNSDWPPFVPNNREFAEFSAKFGGCWMKSFSWMTVCILLCHRFLHTSSKCKESEQMYPH